MRGGGGRPAGEPADKNSPHSKLGNYPRDLASCGCAAFRIVRFDGSVRAKCAIESNAGFSSFPIRETRNELLKPISGLDRRPIDEKRHGVLPRSRHSLDCCPAEPNFLPKPHGRTALGVRGASRRLRWSLSFPAYLYEIFQLIESK
jgi:hypothetical protein